MGAFAVPRFILMPALLPPVKLREGNVFTGVCLFTGEYPFPLPYIGFYEIRSTSGRYASYWNAFLFMITFNIDAGAGILPVCE